LRFSENRYVRDAENIGGFLHRVGQPWQFLAYVICFLNWQYVFWHIAYIAPSFSEYYDSIGVAPILSS